MRLPRIYGNSAAKYRRLLWTVWILCLGCIGNVCAQQEIWIQLPNVRIIADKITRGDGDTYGFGDWQCRFKATIEDASVVLEGNLTFSENANDFTTITGDFRQKIKFEQLEPCRRCRVNIDPSTGWLGGPNVGARGAHWYRGQGLIRRAKMTTDTFGNDVGRVGGTVQFVPLRVLVHCEYVQNEDLNVSPQIRQDTK